MGIINAGTAFGAVVAPPLIATSCSAPTGGGSSSPAAPSASSGVWWWAPIPAGEHRGLSAAERPAHWRRGRGARRASRGRSRGWACSGFVRSGGSWGEVPHRRGVVLLPLLAAEVSVRRARLRREAGGLLRVDSVRRRGHRQPHRRLVLELAPDARPSINAARKIALGASAAVMPLIVFVTHVPVELAIVLFSIAFFGQQSWSTLVMIVPTDIFPAAAWLGRGPGRLWRRDGRDRLEPDGGTDVRSRHGYGTVFAIMGMCHVTAFVLILVAIRNIQPLVSPAVPNPVGRTSTLASTSGSAGSSQSPPSR